MISLMLYAKCVERSSMRVKLSRGKLMDGRIPVAPFSDKINPEDHFWMGLSQAPDIERMPAVVLCPAGHRAYRLILELTADSEHDPVRVPAYGCQACQVLYRYQECPRLPPGEEGLPPCDETPA